jgi:hypothetical protein
MSSSLQTESSEREWFRWLDKLSAFRRQFGHCRVPAKWTGIPGLSKWVHEQRNRFHELELQRLKHLYEFGFDFGSERSWLSRFFELAEYKAEHGHCNVPARWPKNPQLGGWLSGQRARKDSMALGRKRLFDGLGMDWDPLQTAWNRRYDELRAYKEAHGHCNVPGRWPKNPELGLWVGNARNRSKGLTPLQKRKLNQLGFDWSPVETMWKTHLEELRTFQGQHGHCDVPARYPQNKTLASWVWELRSKGQSNVPPRWRRQLKAMGFEWSSVHARWWEAGFSQLAAFKKQFGHCLVPKGWKDNLTLGDWVSTQRTNRNRISPQRRRRLTKLGFVWRLIAMSPRKAWEERYQELAAFKKRFGHCEVPLNWRENSPLGLWVRRQRGRDKEHLSATQAARLTRMGFQWTRRRENNWEQRFAQLEGFHKQYGHCNVPRRWQANPGLREWSLRQRYRKETLSDHRVRKLDRLGFRWLGPRRGTGRSRVTGRFVENGSS